MKGLLRHRPVFWVLALAAAAAIPARAGIPLRSSAGLPLHWDLDVEQPNVTGGRITYYVDPLTSQEEPPGDTTEQVAVMLAASAWESSPGSRVRFKDDSTRPAYDQRAGDRVNYLGWKEFVLGPYTLAATYSTATNGVVKDADIIFNDTVKSVKWATETPGIPGYADVQSVATHELGHFIGLDHSPVAGSTMAAVQAVGSISGRSLSPDDVGALLEAYPNQTDPTVGSIIGKVRPARRRTVRGIPVFALDARTGEVAGCALTGNDGIYRIGGLPPGPYHVLSAPLASLLPYSSWWSGAPVDFLPAILEEDSPGGDRVAATVHVRAGFPEIGKDFTVGRFSLRASGEPDGSFHEARDIPLGGAVAGTFALPLDEDWYRVASEGTNAFDVRVSASGLGADADPEVAVLAEDGGTVFASNIDVRSPTDDANAYGPAGIDRDARIANFVPPGPASFFVRVRAQPLSGSVGPNSFYVLQVLPSAGVPDPVLTTAILTPPATRIPAGPPVTLKAIPRDHVGDLVGPGATVTARRSDGGAPLPLDDRGDGTYAAVVALPQAPGEVRFTIDVVAPRGRASAQDAARLPVAGAVDAAASDFEVVPRRVEADGTAAAKLTFVPKDSGGRPLGPGLSATFAFDGAPAGTLGPVKDLLDGSYEATIVAPKSPGSARVSVLLDDQPTGSSRIVGFGWDLPLVAADLGAEVQEAAGKPGLSKGEAALFDDARAALTSVLASAYAGEEAGAAAAAVKAFTRLAAAGRSPRFAAGQPASREVLEALRRRAHLLVDTVVLAGPDPEKERRLLEARAILVRADAALGAGRLAPAARLYAAAVRRGSPLFQ